MDLNDNKLDEKKETEGVWVPLDTETEILVARWLNPKHRKHVNKVMAPHRKLSRINKLSDDVAEKIEIEAMATCLLLNWKGLKENGKELKYSTEEAIRILSNPAYSWLPDLVRETAQDMELYNEEFVAEGEGNIKKLSSG